MLRTQEATPFRSLAIAIYTCTFTFALVAIIQFTASGATQTALFAIRTFGVVLSFAGFACILFWQTVAGVIYAKATNQLRMVTRAADNSSIGRAGAAWSNVRSNAPVGNDGDQRSLVNNNSADRKSTRLNSSHT